jgi:hypothetical protein
MTFLIKQHAQANNMFLRFTGVFLLFLFGYGNCVKGQSVDCTQTLDQAVHEFSIGHFYGIPELLNPCLENFSKEQSIKAYLLLTQVYLVIDEPLAAEEQYLKLLKVDPEYVASEEKDPIDVVYLSKGFTTRPIFTPRGFLGVNASNARVTSTISTDPRPELSRQTVGIGFPMVGLGLDWNIDNHFSLCMDVAFSTKSYKTEKSAISLRDQQTLIETQRWLDFPLYVKYTRQFGRIKPNISVGFAYNTLVGSTGEFSLINNSDGSIESTTSTGSKDLLYKRNKSNSSLIFGVGSSYKMGRNFITVDVRYMSGLTNLVKAPINFYESDDKSLSSSITQHRFVGDLFKLDNLSISVGYMIPFYKPRKINRAGNGSFKKPHFKKAKKLEKGN